MADAREFDVIVYGATGYTGRLICTYLHRRHAGRVRWAMAGRDRDRLAWARDEAGVPADTPLIVAEAGDTAAVQAMAARTRGLIATTGPYQLHGSSAVAACAALGTDYVDMSGEPVWMREMLDAHEAAAQRSGARIVFSCGFDSIPFDLGVYLLQRRARAAWGEPSPRIRCRLRGMNDRVSGGTAASLRAMLAAIAARPEVPAMMADPFLLTPGWRGADQPDADHIVYDAAIGRWQAPLRMAFINVKHVHRTNWLTGFSYGAGFRYDEAVTVAGDGEQGRAAAEALAAQDPFAGTETLASGDGASAEQRRTHYCDLAFVAEGPPGRDPLGLQLFVGMDPGYEATSRMIVEALLCAFDTPSAGGFWTPAALLGAPLAERLRGAELAFDEADPAALFPPEEIFA